jgi:hypothetical protein
MSIDEAIKTIDAARAEVEWEYPLDYAVAFDVAVKALEKQKKLAEYSGYDICEWNFEEYQPVGRVDDFLIDEAKVEE